MTSILRTSAKKCSATFLTALALSSGSVSFAQNMHTLKIKNAIELQNFFKFTGKDIPIISGHRGGMIEGFPENSIATFENTLKHTPAFYEVDPRLTKDGAVVLLHDATLDRTTTGKGKLSDYTYEQVQQFRLKDPQGNVTSYKIPTLKEAIEWSKGKTILNLDKKDVPIETIAKILKECKNDRIMITVHDTTHAKFYLKRFPTIMLSAHILTVESFKAYEAAGIPWKNMIAYIGPTNKPENKILFDLLHARGVMCMISSSPTYDKLKSKEERAKNYRETFQQGADILESDLPIEAAEAIHGLIPAKSVKSKFFK
jgi:glycerophosphoryl diester phosphodiesterase